MSMKSSSIIQVPRSRSGRSGGGRYTQPESIPVSTLKPTPILEGASTCYKCRGTMPAGTEAYWSKDLGRWRHPGCRPKWVPGARFKR